MRTALALTLSAAAVAGAFAMPASAAPQSAPAASVLVAAEHVASNQGDPNTEAGSHSWEVRVQQVGTAFYAYARHVHTYEDPATLERVQVEEETGGARVARTSESATSTVTLDGHGTLTVSDVQLSFVRKTYRGNAAPVIEDDLTTTLDGTWKRRGGADTFLFMPYDAASDACDGLTPAGLEPDGARSNVSVFGREVGMPVARSFANVAVATYALPGSEGC